ncbi:MAG: sugar-binding protein [Calditrichia bacterium]
MKKCLQALVCVMCFWGVGFAQLALESFDVPVDTNYTVIYASVSDTSEVVLSQETTIVNEGTEALRFDWRAEAAEGWGGFAKMELWNPDSMAVWDFSAFDTIAISYYIDSPSSEPGRAEFRLQLFDVSDGGIDAYDAGATEVWYSFNYILDATPGWNELKIPMEDVGGGATGGSNGFWRTGWAGAAGNDALDLNQIKGLGFEISMTGPQTFDVIDGSMVFDNMRLTGSSALNLVFFNGRVIPTENTLFAWNGSVAVEEGTGATAGTNALRWDQQAGQQWSGFGFDFPSKYLKFRWVEDSLKFKIKAPTGTGTLRVQFADTSGNAVKELITEPAGGYADTWMNISVPLSAIDDFEAGTSLDTTAIARFEILAEASANGYTILFDDMWTGNPSIDVVAPDPPTTLFVVPDNLTNLVTWVDTPNEEGETYQIYYSNDPITDVNAAGVDVVEQGLKAGENSGSLSHLLYSPLADSTVNYYYAVTATDAAGNQGAPVASVNATSNTAKGIATFSLDVPSNFVADGDLSEWASVQPFEMAPSLGTPIVTNTTISGDGDLSLKIYFAVDNDYLYFAMDVTDDVVDTTAGNSYEQDSPDLYLGTYDWRGAPHTSYQRGAMADHHLRFNHNQVILDNIGSAVLLTAGSADYHWETQFPIGYVLEGRLSWADLAAPGSDDVFVPVNGARIPFDISVNDADGGGIREGIMAWSPYNEDRSFQSPEWWLYTWIGNRSNPIVGIGDDEQLIPVEFALEQNYPNPFNPTTTIEYVLAKQSDVKLTVFNTIGQKVATLVNQSQTQGSYSVALDASRFSSGIYFYRLEAGSFTQTRKMILMK